MSRHERTWIASIAVTASMLVGCASADEPEPALDAGPRGMVELAIDDRIVLEAVCEETARDVAVAGVRWPDDCRDIVTCPIRACTGCARWREDSWDGGRYSTDLAEPRRCW